MTQRPEALNWSMEGCTIAGALEIMGDRASYLVMREVVNGVRRFDDIQARVTLPRQVVSRRLHHLVDEGMLRRHPYREPGSRTRDEYRLTDKGFDVYPILVALMKWGDTYVAGPDGPPATFVHADCEAEVEVVLRCADGHEITDMRQVHGRPGPGAKRVSRSRGQ